MKWTALLAATFGLMGGVALALPVNLTLDAAARHLRADSDQSKATKAVWNGRPSLFVDHPGPDGGDAQRQLTLVRADASVLSSQLVTIANEEGGVPEFAAIGFANADKESAKELIVRINWQQVHYDFGGNLWEVRLFDDVKPGQTDLRLLVNLSDHFGVGCDCQWRDGTSQAYRYKTVASVRRELNRLGY